MKRILNRSITGWVLLIAPLALDAQSSRTLTFQNQCPQAVWIGANGGFTQDCGTGNSCPAGQACLTTRNPPGCFWTLPAPASGSFKLEAGASTTVTLSAPAQGGYQWSGNVYGSTGCNSSGQSCKTGCTSGQSCPSGVGPVGPATLAEFTLLPNGADSYDVSMFNGVNLPIQMAPTSGQSFGPTPSGVSGDYWCGSPGSPTASNPALQGCTWTFDSTVNGSDYSAFLRMVVPGGTACTKNSDCKAPQVCGLSLGSNVQQACGQQIGWWTAFEVCGLSPSFGAPFNCTTLVSGQGNNYDLYQCDGTNNYSCYTSGAPATCCGCPKWVLNNKPVPATSSCTTTNPAWTTTAQPWVQLVKNACPTAYSFPFDDPTSSFNCFSQGTSTSTPNTINYTVVYCPGGNTGLPAAALTKPKTSAKSRSGARK